MPARWRPVAAAALGAAAAGVRPAPAAAGAVATSPPPLRAGRRPATPAAAAAGPTPLAGMLPPPSPPPSPQRPPLTPRPMPPRDRRGLRHCLSRVRRRGQGRCRRNRHRCRPAAETIPASPLPRRHRRGPSGRRRHRQFIFTEAAGGAAAAASTAALHRSPRRRPTAPAARRRRRRRHRRRSHRHRQRHLNCERHDRPWAQRAGGAGGGALRRSVRRSLKPLEAADSWILLCPAVRVLGKEAIAKQSKCWRPTATRAELCGHGWYPMKKSLKARCSTAEALSASVSLCYCHPRATLANQNPNKVQDCWRSASSEKCTTVLGRTGQYSASHFRLR